MARIGFYHMVRQPLEYVLPKLLEKAIASGARVVVLTGSPDRVVHLDELLWTYAAESWLPHGAATQGGGPDEDAAIQPIWVTAGDENPNQATMLMMCDGAVPKLVESWSRCFNLFDGTDQDAVAAARASWKLWKEQGHELVYYQQTERGGWEEKART